ncbi:MAG: rod shape-determining protein MreD [Alphaproteobacteria bacterium]|nr:rod shape-determining protein MreD [Alphaproteobacteria bacterium]
MRVTSIPALPRVNNGIGRAWPLFTTLVMAVLTMLPVRIPGYAALTPAFTLMAVYHWTIYRPDLLPSTGLFAIGLVEDLLTGAPVGAGTLVLLIARAGVLRYRRLFVNRGFPFVWAGFTLLAAAVMGMLWAFNCLIMLDLIDIRATVFRLVLTVAAFPAASFALGRSQRVLIDAHA